MILENFVYPSFCSKKIFQDLEFSRSRALMGETVFTSFRTFSNGIPFLNDHIKRLELGSLFLFNKRISKTEILGELKNLLKVVSVPLKIRISVFESQKDLEFIITTGPLEILKKEPLNITRAVKVRTSGLLPSYLKIGNYVETNLEIKRAKELGFEDIFFLDNRNNILECSTSNIFTIKNNKALTPLDNGLFLNGITRQKIIEMLSANKIFIEETNLNYYDFLQSDEIFICNSVKGIRFIGKIEDKKFENHKISKKICEIFDDFLRKNCE